jgi:GT2 family glycosyltransferase
MRTAALIAAHNRRDKTLACLRSLTRSWPAGHALTVVVVDDGSTDGTAYAVESEFPDAVVVRADGDLYWCRGMALAWAFARRTADVDGVLWLNDDVALDESAGEAVLAAATRQASAGRHAILVGATCDPSTLEPSYGGLRLKSSWHPGKHERVVPNGTLQPVDTFNGNFVYVPGEVENAIGRIHDGFAHATGDTEYGLRARAAGVEILLLPNPVGFCSRGRGNYTFRAIFGKKGLPWRDWLFVTRRYTRFHLWPIAFFGPYVRMTGRSILIALRSRSSKMDLR